ncbi:SPOR domain-containing protein [Idiomarina sp. HP20-50]|uniref:SPOR domain-containing protein n=1 Tax=Idiomarina sp. HP20-50 TaxID=3070813 RepID=UPI00294AAFCB|nr:SPOR domain-containing protein [Idiomarina sp. HP20-50]MDV6316841.1 SPOR domain-containing protein [Idiomarina sp. HP20-50]
MSSSLQNRLVGTFILAALAVIIIPDVLDGEKKGPVEPMETIPLKPNVEETLEKPKALSESTVAEPVTVDAEKKASIEKTADSAAPIEKDETVKAPSREPQEYAVDGKAWVIQLGAFSQEDSVNRLISQLQDRGFAAYSEKVPGSSLIRVLVGPDTSQVQLEQQLEPLKELTGLNGKVMTYQP